MLNSLMVSALQLSYDEILSNFAFNSNLRRYNEGARAHVRMDGPGGRVVGLRPANLVVLPEDDGGGGSTTGVDELD
jgi:hypothetical protein